MEEHCHVVTFIPDPAAPRKHPLRMPPRKIIEDVVCTEGYYDAWGRADKLILQWLGEGYETTYRRGNGDSEDYIPIRNGSAAMVAINWDGHRSHVVYYGTCEPWMRCERNG